MSYINKENIDLFVLFYQPMYDDSEKNNNSRIFY